MQAELFDMSREEVMAAALDLSRDDRAALAERLLASLEDEPEDLKIEALWLAEAERRLAEIRSGTVLTVSGPEAFRQVREALG